MKNPNLLFLLTLCISFFFISGCVKDKNEAECEKYNFKELNFEYYQPNCINFLFQVTDSEGLGVVGLTESDFKVLENDKLVGSEAGVTIVPNDQIPYTIKTVLLIDVSTSVQSEIAGIKQAAITMANNKASNQEIAVFTFSSSLNMELNFSGNKVDIVDAINNISVGSSSTNLYGALVGVSNLYTEIYTLQEIIAGNIVLFTDGDDTQGSTIQSSAINAMADKSLYIVALNGPDYTDDTRTVMNSFKPIKLLESSNVSELAGLFDEAIQNIIRISKSTYWLYFSSPKRGGNTHQLSLQFNCENNSNSISSSFNSTGFTDGTCSAAITPSGNYDCITGNCQSSSNGSYASLSACQTACGSSTGSYDCVNGNCQTSINGIYSTLSSCQAACGGSSGTVYFSNDFNSGFLNMNVFSTSSDVWTLYNSTARMYNSDINGSISDLKCNPTIDLSSSVNPILTFDNLYDLGATDLTLEVFKASTSTWTNVDISSVIASTTATTWVNSSVSLSAFNGETIFFKFVYTSPSLGGIWQIDNIILKEQ